MKRNSEMIGGALLIIAIGASLGTCAPTTRPLEHSPSELAWDAWLQQGSRQAAPPRRITTKSLFVFPLLGPESLPACAEGYRPDSMGRCVKVIKVNENAHLEFLLQKLNSQFATETSENLDESYDYDIDTEAPDTSGPFQFNIPLALPVSKKETSEEIVVTKKEPLPPKRLTAEKIPTSSPEVVPEYNDNDKKQFFLDSTPASTEGLLQQNHSASAGSVSILLRNSTGTGITLLAPTNGKFENLTSEENNKHDGTELIKELENVKVDIIKKQNDKLVPEKENLEALPTTINPVSELPPREILISQSSFVNNAHHKVPDAQMSVATSEIANLPTKNSTREVSVVSKSGFVQSNLTDQTNKLVNNVTTEGTKNETDVNLVNQIEALKAAQQPDKSLSNSASAEKSDARPGTALSQAGNRSACSDCQTEDSSPVASSVNPFDDKRAVDLEEKIKKISQFADVSRNSDEKGPTPDVKNAHKKTSDERILFPSNLRNGDGGLDLNKAASSSSSVRFPANYETVPAFRDSVSGGNGVPSAVYQQTYQPVIDYQRDRHFQESNNGRPPYWLPYGWNVNNPSGEHNLMDLWSRMSSSQRYPYDVRFENDRPPARHHAPPLFPNSRESGGRLSVRHTPVSYRQGRDNAQRRRQVHQDESTNYKRSRHPHFRESEELSRIIEAFNGR